MHPITALVDKLVRGICLYPDQAKVEESFQGSDLTITLTPSKTDYGALCGRQGRVIKSLNWLVEEAGRFHGIGAGVKLVDSFVGTAERRAFVPEPNFDNKKLEQFLQDWLRFLVDGRPMVMVKPSLCLSCTTTVKISGAEGIVVSALDEVFRPYCMRSGRRVRLEVYESPTIRTRAVQGEQRERKGGVSR